MKRNRTNYWIYLGMITVFGVLIYFALSSGERFDHQTGNGTMNPDLGAFELFTNIVADNMTNYRDFAHRPVIFLSFQISRATGRYG